MPLLLLTLETPLADAVRQALVRDGQVVIEFAQPETLVSHVGASASGSAPQQVIVAGTGAFDGLGDLLGVWGGLPPCAVTLIGEVPSGLVDWLGKGLTGWWPAGLLDSADALAAALAADRVRWQREADVRAALALAQEQLDGRKWVERAKGVLMAARGMGEDEAFRLLRNASMQANLKVGEVSRSVLEAAQWADAVNRAGQLRMLSQRVVKLAAQRLAGVDPRRARDLQDQATHRTRDNLVQLSLLLPAARTSVDVQAALAAASQAWSRLEESMALRQSRSTLVAMDRRAEALLDAADALADALEVCAGRRALHVVNLCGRQRMRVQRLAKTVLMGVVKGEPVDSGALAPQLDEFEGALLALERVPLSNAEIRVSLTGARDEWLRLLHGLRGTDGADDHLAALARSSDLLLETFDTLTASYEHSLQVMLS